MAFHQPIFQAGDARRGRGTWRETGRAAWMKAATWRHLSETWWIALQHRASLGTIQMRCRGDQGASIWVARCSEDIASLAFLNNLTEIHDSNPITHAPDDG